MTQRRNKFLITLAIAFVPLCILAALVYGVITAYTTGKVDLPYYSSPTAVRQNAKTEWDRLMNPIPAYPPSDAAFLDAIETSPTQGGIAYITPPTPDLQNIIMPYDVHHADANHHTEFAGGTVELVYWGINDFRHSPGNPNSDAVLYFSMDGQPLSKEQTERVVPRNYRTSISNGNSPQTLIFGFAIDGLVDPQILNITVVDGQTYYKSYNSWSTGSIRDGHLHSMLHITDYKLGPQRIALDIATGPVIRHSFRLDGPQDFVYEPHGLRIRQLGTFDGDISSSSYNDGYEGQSGKTEFGFNPNPREEKSNIALAANQRMWGLALKYKAYDRNNKEVRGNGWDSATLMRILNFPKEDFPRIDRVEIEYRPNYHRIVFDLPSLPGAKPLRQDVDNLFALQIASLDIDSHWRLRNTIRNSVQMDLNSYPNPTYPLNYFPRTYTDVTPADLLDEFISYLPPGSEIEVDPEDNEIRPPKPKIKQTFIERILNRF